MKLLGLLIPWLLTPGKFYKLLLAIKTIADQVKLARADQTVTVDERISIITAAGVGVLDVLDLNLPIDPQKLYPVPEQGLRVVALVQAAASLPDMSKVKLPDRQVY